MDRIKRYLQNKEYRKLFSNITNFSIFQITNYLVPLITIPYIVRIIGPEKFGIISFAQVVNQYFLIFSDYGFDISGTQKIAQSRKSKLEINQIFSAVMTIRMFMALLSFMILILLITFVDDVNNYALVYFFAFGIVPGNILLSVWFFVGMEEMKYIKYVNFIQRIGYLIFIFIFINEEHDFFLIPAINSGFMIIAGFTSIFYIIKHFKISFNFPSLENLKYYITDGRHIFISNLAINLYRNTNVFILGLIASKEIVGLYSAGEKLIKIIQSAFAPITRSLYPYISRQKSISSIKSIKIIIFLIKILGLFSFITSLIFLIYPEQITSFFFGEKFILSANVIKISSLAIMFGVVNYIIGIIFMTNYDMKKEFSICVILTGIVNVILCSFFSYYWLEIGAAISFIGAEIILLILMIYFITKRKNRLKYALNEK